MTTQDQQAMHRLLDLIVWVVFANLIAAMLWMTYLRQQENPCWWRCDKRRPLPIWRVAEVVR